MTRYLLDTTALVLSGRHTEPFTSRVRALIDGPDEVGICAVNVAEFFAGVRPGSESTALEFLDALGYWDIERADAIRAGVIRHTWARRGRPLQTTDCLIAAVAVRVGATVITENLKDFPMPEVRAISLLADEFSG